MSICLCHALGRRGFLAAAVSAAALPAAGRASPDAAGRASPDAAGRASPDAAGRASPDATASAPPASAGPVRPALLDDLVAANHILYQQGVVDGFGHVSVRHDRDPNRYLLARSMAPSLVTGDDILEYDLDSTPIDPRGRASYLERFIHGELYKARPEVIAIVHSHSPSVIPFADTKVALRPMNHMAAFLGTGAPVFEIRDTAGPATDMLIRTPSLGHALAAAMGDNPVVLMRGHGSVAAGASIRQAVFRAVYTEVNARVQEQAMQLGPPTFLTPGEAKAASRTVDTLVGRAWEMWQQQAMGKS